MLKKLSHIARGWMNFIKGDPYVKEIMNKRLEICDTCVFKEQLSDTGKFIVNLVNNEASMFQCGKCKCPLSAKTADPTSECPIGKWGIAGSE